MIGNDIVDLALARKESNWRRKGFLEKIFTAHEQQLIRTAVDPDQMVWLLWSMKESAYKIAVRDSGKRCFAPIQLACDLTEWTHHKAEGTLCYEEKEYLTRSSLTAQYIATVSTNKLVLPAAVPRRDAPASAVLRNCNACFGNPTASQRRTARFGVRGQGCPRSKRAKYTCLHAALSAYHTSFDHIIVPLEAMTYPQQHAILWGKIKQHYATALSVPEAEIHFHKDEAGAPGMTLPSEEKVPLSVSHHGRFGAFVISSPQTYSP